MVERPLLFKASCVDRVTVYVMNCFNMPSYATDIPEGEDVVGGRMGPEMIARILGEDVVGDGSPARRPDPRPCRVITLQCWVISLLFCFAIISMIVKHVREIMSDECDLLQMLYLSTEQPTPESSTPSQNN